MRNWFRLYFWPPRGAHQKSEYYGKLGVSQAELVPWFILGAFADFAAYLAAYFYLRIPLAKIGVFGARSEVVSFVKFVALLGLIHALVGTNVVFARWVKLSRSREYERGTPGPT